MPDRTQKGEIMKNDDCKSKPYVAATFGAYRVVVERRIVLENGALVPGPPMCFLERFKRDRMGEKSWDSVTWDSVTEEGCALRAALLHIAGLDDEPGVI